MSKIEINECVYSVHQIYDLYAADENGKIINIVKKVPTYGTKQKNGYLFIGARKYGHKPKSMQAHRFIWECFNGVIPAGKVIDHINDDKQDNRLCNLQMMTQQENCKKSAKNRDYAFAANNNKNRKCVKATNMTTKEVSYFFSMYSVQKNLGINAGVVKMTCEGDNYCKTGKSKKDGYFYKFEYIDEKELPEDQAVLASQKAPRVSSKEEKNKRKVEMEKRWRKKEYQCLKCGKNLQRGSKFLHDKTCNGPIPQLTDEEKKIRQAEAMKKWAKKEYICPKCNKKMTNGSRCQHYKICLPKWQEMLLEQKLD